MARINEHYLKLRAGYLFPEIGRRVAAYAKAHPDARIIRMGIGDVTEPLPAAAVAAMASAVAEMGVRSTFRGYGPEQGYPFLIDKIVEHDFRARGVAIEADEVFVSDGAKCDTGNILDVLGADNQIAVVDPVYPVYVDTNVMAGNTGPCDDSGRFGRLTYLPATAENDFNPALPSGRVDIIYLCSPNNPTGTVMDRATLARWVDYARANESIVLFDAAYEVFISDPAIPHSIYEVPGAQEVAIEFRSFSKTGGFTGTRCAYTVVPKALLGRDAAGARVAINPLWHRRQTTKFNGVSYPVQRAAEALYSAAGRAQVEALVRFYLENARLIRAGLEAVGLPVYGGVHAPYLWVRTPRGQSSWDFFDRVLAQLQIVTTPGSGFGRSGEGYFRVSAFNSRENVLAAVERFRRL